MNKVFMLALASTLISSAGFAMEPALQEGWDYIDENSSPHLKEKWAKQWGLQYEFEKKNDVPSKQLPPVASKSRDKSIEIALLEHVKSVQEYIKKHPNCPHTLPSFSHLQGKMDKLNELYEKKRMLLDQTKQERDASLQTCIRSLRPHWQETGERRYEKYPIPVDEIAFYESLNDGSVGNIDNAIIDKVNLMFYAPEVHVFNLPEINKLAALFQDLQYIEEEIQALGKLIQGNQQKKTDNEEDTATYELPKWNSQLKNTLGGSLPDDWRFWSLAGSDIPEFQQEREGELTGTGNCFGVYHCVDLSGFIGKTIEFTADIKSDNPGPYYKLETQEEFWSSLHKGNNKWENLSMKYVVEPADSYVVYFETKQPASFTMKNLNIKIHEDPQIKLKRLEEEKVKAEQEKARALLMMEEEIKKIPAPKITMMHYLEDLIMDDNPFGEEWEVAGCDKFGVAIAGKNIGKHGFYPTQLNLQRIPMGMDEVNEKNGALLPLSKTHGGKYAFCYYCAKNDNFDENISVPIFLVRK